MNRYFFFYLFLVTGFFRSLEAQTGPGGVGTSATNVLWLSADNGVYNNAGTTLASSTDNVQQWNDRSGNSKNASQVVAANRPNYITSVINSLPVLRFSAGNDHIIAASVNTANVASVWAVAAYAGLPSSNPGIVIAAPAATGSNVAPANKTIGMWVSSGGGTQVWGRGIQSNATTRDISLTTTLNSATFYIINTIYRSAASINQFVNGATAGNNNSHNGTLSSWTDVTVGRQGTESWNGDIAEIVFYNTEVNSAQKIIIDNYLAAKYGLSLSVADVYDKDNAGNGNYDFEVAGIGRVDASNIQSAAQGSGIVRMLNPTGLGNDEFLLWGHDNASLQATNFTDVPAGVQGRMARVWRVSEVNVSSASVDVGSVDVQFDLTGLGAVTASDLRLLIDTDNDGVFSDETGISGASLLSGSVYQFSGVTAITNNVRFSLGTISKMQTPLPVELLYFNAELLADNTVELRWGTAIEKNNAYFEIQRSPDGADWETLETVPGAISTSLKKSYKTLDKYPLNQLSYYRLQQVDLDGGTKISPVIEINLENRLNYTVQVYPNPALHSIIVQGNATELESLLAYDKFGRSMNLSTITVSVNANKLILDLTTWLPGIYFFRTKSSTMKVVKT